MKRKITYIWQLLRCNWMSLTAFEVLYKLMGTAIGIPMLYWIIQGGMKLAGYHYLTYENLKKFLLHPVTIPGLLLIYLIIVCYWLFDASALIFLTAQSHEKKKVTVLQTVCFAAGVLHRIFRRGNRSMLLWHMLLIPFLSIGILWSIGSTVTIPNFIRHAFTSNRQLTAGLLLGLVLLAVWMLRYIYILPYFVLEGCGYKEAKQRSKILSLGNKWKDGLVLVWTQVLFCAGYIVLAALGILVVLLVAKLCLELHLLNYVYTSAVWGLLEVIMLIVIAAGMPIGYGCISFLYYLHKDSNQEPVLQDGLKILPVEYGKLKRVRAAEALALAVGIAGSTLLIYSSSTERLNPQVEYLRTIEVTAHRGASAFYPENTMAAFEGAAEFGADWIELDVQQSKDGQIFVMHDHNFYRTTGVRKFNWELTYREISQLDAGSYFSETYAGEKIPLLSEVIEFAKEKHIKLNIELKPTAMDENMEQRVVDLVREMDYADSCILSSQDYDALKTIKEYDEGITTVYVCSLAYGNVNRLKAADGFSLEAGSVTPSMVTRIHNAGKQIYVWTVNSRKTVNRMIDLNVDNIITDRVAMVQECVYEEKTNDVIRQYVRFLRDL